MGAGTETARRLLVVDDDPAMRTLLARVLQVRGYEVLAAKDVAEGLRIALAEMPPIILCDLNLPDGSGVELLEEIGLRLPETLVIMMTGAASLETALDSIRKGALDYVLKPVNMEDLLQKVDRIWSYRQLQDDIRHLRRGQFEGIDSRFFVGRSPSIKHIQEMVETVSQTRTTVLIRGETGVGKELVARSIHSHSSEIDKPFLAVNCAALPENLIESELFGYVKGAFTGADRDKAGLLESADGGTLFLDEVGELPMGMQAKLLRVLEERRVTRIGAVESRPFDVRVIAATNRDLRTMIQEGSFRDDLYYRLRVLEIEVPPLRERPDDIPLLIERFIAEFNTEMKRNVKGVENEAMRAIMAYAWPGNIRELRNALERSMLFQHEGFLSLKHLPAEVVERDAASYPVSLDEALRQFARDHIARVLDQVNGNRSEAARMLGIDRSTLYRKLAELDRDEDAS